MRRFSFSFLLLVLHLTLFAQLPTEAELHKKTVTAASDAERITALSELASFYMIYRADKQADSVLRVQLSLAEASNDNTLIVQTLFSSALNNIQSWSGKETFEKALAFTEKGLRYAKEANLEDLELTAHLKRASILRKRNSFDEAISELSKGFSYIGTSKNDSLQSIFFIELGDCFLGKQEPVAAYSNYNKAYNLAYATKALPLLTTCLRKFAALYKSLGDSDQAKTKLLESISLDEKNHNAEGLIEAYYDLTRLTDDPVFVLKGMKLADSLASARLRIFGKIIYLSYLMVIEKDSKASLAYLTNNPDLRFYYNNQGIPDFTIGNIYLYSHEYDSALHYYQRAEPLFVKDYEAGVQYNFYLVLAEAYEGQKNYVKALEAAERAASLSQATVTANVNARVAAMLSRLYAATGNYKEAYVNNQRYIEYFKSVTQAADQRKVFLLAVERERKKNEKDLLDAAEADRTKKQAQYLGISIATAFLFIILIVFGMFPISRTTIRMLNFVAFICLFEFIILLIDNWLHHLTHGSPLYIWLGKIVIIALLLPLHHTLEHVTVKFLSSEKLMHFRQRFSWKKLFRPSKAKLKKVENEMEAGTLI